jgi:hypothetical protein
MAFTPADLHLVAVQYMDRVLEFGCVDPMDTERELAASLQGRELIGATHPELATRGLSGHWRMPPMARASLAAIRKVHWLQTQGDARRVAEGSERRATRTGSTKASEPARCHGGVANTRGQGARPNRTGTLGTLGTLGQVRGPEHCQTSQRGPDPHLASDPYQDPYQDPYLDSYLDPYLDPYLGLDLDLDLNREWGQDRGRDRGSSSSSSSGPVSTVAVGTYAATPPVQALLEAYRTEPVHQGWTARALADSSQAGLRHRSALQKMALGSIPWFPYTDCVVVSGQAALQADRALAPGTHIPAAYVLIPLAAH